MLVKVPMAFYYLLYLYILQNLHIGFFPRKEISAVSHSSNLGVFGQLHQKGA